MIRRDAQKYLSSLITSEQGETKRDQCIYTEKKKRGTAIRPRSSPHGNDIYFWLYLKFCTQCAGKIVNGTFWIRITWTVDYVDLNHREME